MLELARARAQRACWSPRPARARRWPASCRRICELAEAAGRRPAHALRLAAEGARGRRPAQPASARSRRWACRSGSRRAPATRRRTARRGSGCKPPQMLLTTPESLSLLLSYPDSAADVRGPQDDRRRRAPRLRQGKARRPAVAVDGAAADARARACAASACRRRSAIPTPIAAWLAPDADMELVDARRSAIRAPSPTSRS